MVCSAVSALSDDEGQGEVAKSQGSGKPKRYRLPRYKKRSVPEKNSVSLTRCRNLISGKCGCSCKCFTPFSESLHCFDEWVALRRTWAKLTKLEKDNHAIYLALTKIRCWIPTLACVLIASYFECQCQPVVQSVVPRLSPRALEVFNHLKEFGTETCRGSRSLKVCGHLVCNRGYMKLVGIGKRRFQVLISAVKNGEQCPPFDLRYVPRGPQLPSDKANKIYAFLMELYTDLAEHIPDGLNSNKRPRHGGGKFDDRTMDRSTIKHLPAASISDYHRQCQDAHPGEVISRKLFCSVPKHNYESFLCTFWFWGV